MIRICFRKNVEPEENPNESIDYLTKKKFLSRIVETEPVINKDADCHIINTNSEKEKKLTFAPVIHTKRIKRRSSWSIERNNGRNDTVKKRRVDKYYEFCVRHFEGKKRHNDK